MMDWRFVATHLILAIFLMQWSTGKGPGVEAAPEQAVNSIAESAQSHIENTEEKSATELTQKLLFLDELVSLENDVIETKKKRSFPVFGAPLDRLSAGSFNIKGKQRKTVELPKRRFGVPIDRIGSNRLANTRG
ncbi:osteocrin [Trichosurus vulpecula]|uniref:osteocrin n=1 Tax=Trichosurus vulpecula TaxID=9337 RepID=UPI00186B04F0|nr:osteocrin [Trichosurus vulpecula]